MTPDPTLIMKAPGCKRPLKFRMIASGNTFGARYWTDGKREAPMLPDEPWLRKSPSEGVLFWADACEEIGQIDDYRDAEQQLATILGMPSGVEGHGVSSAVSIKEKAEWKELEFAEEPSEEDYFAALTSGIADTDEKMMYLRMRLWWVGNDAVRRGTLDTLSPRHIENLTVLEDLLSEEDPNQRLMNAEILRELGRFSEALELLRFEYPQNYSHSVERIRSLCELNETKVAEIG